MEQRIGRYQLLDEIAAGGQGTVHRAFDPDSGQIIALKVLHPTLSGDRGYIERFRREASLAASINHPNVVKIFEVGQDGDRHFMAMEFLPESLARVVESGGQMRLEGAAQFGLQIAEGLAAAHALGIVHRDIKPQNVLIGPDGAAKVTDFGIARAESLNTMTATGVVMGTPHYMSPEQARGERADTRSDVYSLGCMMYHMLAGQVPFTGETPLAVIRQQIEEQPRRLRDRRKDLPRSLEALIERAMAKDPSRRYEGAGEMAEAIRAATPRSSKLVTPDVRRGTRRRAATPPPTTPEPPSTTWMNDWAVAWRKAHGRRLAWVGTLISLSLALTIAGVQLDGYDRVREFIDSTGWFVTTARTVATPAQPEPTARPVATRVPPEPIGTPAPTPAMAIAAQPAPTARPVASRVPPQPTLTPAPTPAMAIAVQPAPTVTPAPTPTPGTVAMPTPAAPVDPEQAFADALSTYLGRETASYPFVSTGGSWKVSDFEQPGWTELGFDDRSWVDAVPSRTGWADWDPGIFSPSPQPIWYPGRHEDDFIWYYFRKSFDVPMAEPLGLAELTIQVDDDYVLFLNGAEVARDESGVTEPPTTYDVLPYLHAGENLIAVAAIDSSGADEWVAVGLRLAPVGVDVPVALGDPNPEIHILAYVDGRSQLLLRGRFAQWFHMEYAAPGRQLFSDFPTFLNGTEWLPEWPDDPDAENRDCFCESSIFESLQPALPQAETDVQLHVLLGRGLVSIIERPEEDNDFTLTLEIDDNDFSSPDWYEIVISVAEPQPVAAATLLAAATPTAVPTATPVLAVATPTPALAAPAPEATYQVRIEGPREAGPMNQLIFDVFMGSTDGAIDIDYWAGGSFEAFVHGKADLNISTGPIKDRDAAIAAENGVEYLELPVAFDSLAVTVHPDNEFLSCLTVEDLNAMWSGSSAPERWENVDADWPDEPIAFYGPSADSAAYRFFTEQVMGGAAIQISHQTVGTDDAVLREVIADNPNAFGYVPYATYLRNPDTMKPVAIDDLSGCVAPSLETIQSGAYAPLSRPLLIYVNATALQRSEVAEFVVFYIEAAFELSHDPAFGYVPLSYEDIYSSREKFLTAAEAAPAPTAVPVATPAPPGTGLVRGATVSGRVTDVSTGLPISDVDMVAHREGKGDVAWAKTGGDGIYALTGLPAGVFRVQALSERYINQETTVTVDVAGSALSADFVLNQGASITGTVTDAETGLPVANVHLEAGPQNRGNVAHTHTRADGSYILMGLPDGITDVYANSQNYIDWNSTADVRGAGVAHRLDIELESGATISGTVFDSETGLPIADASVDSEPDGRGQGSHARTDANGFYTLRGVAPGVYWIIVRAASQGYFEQSFENAVRWDDAQLIAVGGAEGIEGIDFGLRPGATISGRITGADTGLPIAGVRVEAVNISGGRNAAGRSGADGVYTLKGIAPGTYHILTHAESPDYIQQFYQNAIFEDDARPVDIVGPEEVRGIDFALNLGATISGTVLDSETGLPIADAEVDAVPDGRGRGSTANTDATGFYTLRGIAPGAYRIIVRAASQGYFVQFFEDALRWDDAQLITVGSAEGIEGIDLGLRLGATIAGRITDADTGLPIAGVLVEAVNISGGENAWGRSDPDGAYTVKGVAPGTYHILTHPESPDYIQQYYQNVIFEADGHPVGIVGPEEVHGIDFVLKLGAAISGRVVDGSTGQPIPNMEIRAGPAGRDHLARDDSGSDGTYVLRGMPDGLIEVVVQGQGYLKVSNSVVIRDGEDVTNFDF